MLFVLSIMVLIATLMGFGALIDLAVIGTVALFAWVGQAVLGSAK